MARGTRGVSPTLALAVFGGAGASNVALDLGLTGPSVGNANSCASGAMAIGQAFHAIRDGTVDLALAGGAEAPLAPLTFGAFALIRVLSSRNDDPAAASRPFDRDRDGFVMGESAAILVLEELEAARGRGATPIAEVLGFGASNDAYHMTAPRPDGRDAARAIREALADAGLEPERIGYVNAHGSSTPLNEPAEARAIRTAFGDHADGTRRLGHEGPVRPRARCVRRGRGRHHGPRAPARDPARDLQPSHPRPGDRARRAHRGPTPRGSTRRSRTRSGSVG